LNHEIRTGTMQMYWSWPVEWPRCCRWVVAEADRESDGTPRRRTWKEDEPWCWTWAVARSASQKPNSPSPGAGSQRRVVPETYSPVYRCTPALGME